MSTVTANSTTTSAESDRTPLPLEGVRVLDLSHVLAGPYCTMFLAQAGAEVIKLEPPQGELGRRQMLATDDGRRVPHVAAYLHRGKKAITLNLRTPRGKEIFLELVKSSDILVENFTARTMQKLGLSYEALRKVNPGLIYTSVSGFGHDDVFPGPFVDRPAFNLIAQAMGGIMDITGERDGPPIPTGVPLGDLVAAVFALAGTLMALRMREVTGLGQHVDISMYDCLASFSQRAFLRYFLTGDVPTRGNDKRENPLGAFKVKDGYVVVTTMGDAMWDRLCTAIQRPELRDDPRFNPDTARGAAFDGLLKPILEEWARDRTRTEVVDTLLAADVPVAPVQSVADMLDCPQLRARNMVSVVKDPHYGELAFTGNPLKLSGVPEQEPSPAPLLSEHTEHVLGELLGLSSDDVAELRRESVV